MADLSVAVLVGRLTRDAELKYTNSGQAVCHFSVATSSRKKKGDQWVDEASFWDVDLWGKQGESINQYLVKGKLVAIEGSMRQDRWEQDGQSRMKVIINANTVQLLGSNSAGGQQYGGSQGAQDGPREYQPREGGRQQGPAAQAPASDDFSDDIPF
ncbi:MAG: single-stranded DNA-binding protein [Spirochaetes bacterium]|nr:single-stranded DNA-binding protein [Spirochaetota bacterium]MBU1081364.1 single-stranded DNA-binding protein [Spirochaetota bacterium]